MNLPGFFLKGNKKYAENFRGYTDNVLKILIDQLTSLPSARCEAAPPLPLGSHTPAGPHFKASP
jgi:hypothetical protein